MTAIMLCALAIAGTAYAWCPHMQRVAAGCCASKHQGPSQDAAVDAAPTVASGDCCDTHSIDELPVVQHDGFAQLLVVPPAPLAGLAWSAPAAPPRSWVRAPQKWQGGPIRAGPKAARERRALLQIYLL